MTSSRKRQLPDDWKATMRDVTSPLSNYQLGKRFNTSSSVILRWQEENPEFAEACLPFVKAPIERPKITIPDHLTPDQIDDVLLDLYLAPDAYTLKLARLAIRQLRRERKEALSEVNRLKVAEHYRKTSRGSSVHASGGKCESRAPYRIDAVA